MAYLPYLYMTTGKNIALIRWTFVGKVMSLPFYTLSRVSYSFPSKKQVSFNFVAEVIIHNDFRAQENKLCQYFHCFPIYLPWSDGTGCDDLSFLSVSFKTAFSLSCLTFIKRLISSSSLSAIRVVSSAFLRLLIFLLEILIPPCASSSPAFCMMYSTQKLNKQGDSIQPWGTLFPILN